MWSVVVSLLHSFRFLVQSRASLHVELIAPRHQLAVVHRSRRPRLRFTAADRILCAWLSRSWRGGRSAVHIVKPETVIATGFASSGPGKADTAPAAQRCHLTCARSFATCPPRIPCGVPLGCTASS